LRATFFRSSLNGRIERRSYLTGRFTGTLVSTASSALLVACAGNGNLPSNDLLDLVNEKRAAAGCPKVTGDEQLRVAAERHAVDIRDHPGRFGSPGTPPLRDLHTGTDGSNPSKRIDAAGYSPKSRWGEVIYTASGAGYKTARATIDWWMNSPPHKATIENCAFTNAGVGLLYPSGVQWIAVVDFATH
jgi:uncharacterized protein YkwD